MASRIWIKFKTVLVQNSSAFLIVLLWFIANMIYFTFETQNFFRALQIVFYFRSEESLYGNFYSSFTEFIIFGLVFSLITIELFRKYNPVDTSRKLASDLKNHIIILGYGHIGQRIAKHLESIGEKVVVIETDKSRVEELIDLEKPVVIDPEITNQTLLDSGIKEAKAVFILTNDLEILMVACSSIRRYNKSCKLTCRIFQDDIAQVITNTFKAKTISTSKYAAEVIMEEIEEKDYNNIIIIGLTHITVRIINEIKKSTGINYNVIEEDEEKIEEHIFEVSENVIIGDPREYLLLQKANVREADLVINTNREIGASILITKRIRDLNPECKIISRIFPENIADIISKPPFKSQVISSSKTTLKNMIKHHMLDV